jgi:acetyl-CoA acyltransferase
VAARYPDGLVPQGVSAELIAARWELPRSELDRFSLESHQRAAAAHDGGAFDDELIPMDGLDRDESVRPGTTLEALAGLKPAFEDPAVAERFPQIDWKVTAGNSSRRSRRRWGWSPRPACTPSRWRATTRS